MLSDTLHGIIDRTSILYIHHIILQMMVVAHVSV